MHSRHELRPLLPDFRQNGGGPVIFRVEVDDDILPGQSGDCHPIYWDGSNWTKSDDVTLTLYDALGHCCALKTHNGSTADRLWAIWTPEMVGSDGDTDRCEVLGEFGLRRIGKLAGSLSQGGSATVNLWCGSAGSEAVVSGVTVTGQDWLMKAGATAIASGKKVVVEYINGIWYVTEGECA